MSTPPTEASSAAPDRATVAWNLEGVTHAFPGPPPVAVLDDVSLSARPGEFVSLVGPSGCGKSTVLRALAGLLVPDAGDVQVGGRDVAGRPGACAFQPQRDTLLPWKRALDNATLGAVLAGVPRKEAERQAREQWRRFGLEGYEEVWPDALSGGMRQRLALLRAFLVPAPVLLLDEPLGALDAITRRDLQLWLEGVWGPDGRAVLLVTHDMEEALLLSDRVVVLSDRPARVLADIPVRLPRPRPDTVVLEGEFVRLRGEVLEALRTGHRLH